MLLRHGDRAILIDGIHRPYGEAYAVLPENERADLENAAGRWSGIDLIVATHDHGDHVSPEAVAAHLKANPEASFVGPPSVANKVLAAGAPGRVFSVPWGPGSSARLPNLPDIEIYNLRHGGETFAELENIGVVVTIDEVSVFHPGDASADPENFEPFAADLKQLDIAVLPTWFFTENNPIKARRYFAMHIDPRDAAATAARLEKPGTVALTEMLESQPLCK